MTNIEQANEIAGDLGYLGYIPGPQQAYVGFLSSNPSAMTSLAFLLDKIHNGTAERHDYESALNALAGVGLGVAELAMLGGVLAPAEGLLLGIGLGLAVLDYADEHGYNPFEIQDDLERKLDALKDWMIKNNYDLNIKYLVNDLWNAAQNWTPPRHDPLVLDMDGDGIETVGINAINDVVFDADGDGLKTGTGWVKADEEVNGEARETTLGCALLVYDRNGNGTIDDGSEFFGDQTMVDGVRATDGFAALTGEDTNNDGVFDANDTNYTNVRIWQDKNQDGISQSDELRTLSEAGIASISLTTTATNKTTNGNTQTMNNQALMNIVASKHVTTLKGR